MESLAMRPFLYVPSARQSKLLDSKLTQDSLLPVALLRLREDKVAHSRKERLRHVVPCGLRRGELRLEAREDVGHDVVQDAGRGLSSAYRATEPDAR